MKWNNGEHCINNLRREARRIVLCAEENALSTRETNALALAAFEIGWAIADAQRHPTGHEKSLSAECIGLFERAAQMARNERKEHGLYSETLVLLEDN